MVRKKIIGFFPWLNQKNSLILWWQFLHPLDVSKSLETPINKGFLESSKNYEFEPISAITVPKYNSLTIYYIPRFYNELSLD